MVGCLLSYLYRNILHSFTWFNIMKTTKTYIKRLVNRKKCYVNNKNKFNTIELYFMQDTQDSFNGAHP